jgi:hypothetical protein
MIPLTKRGHALDGPVKTPGKPVAHALLSIINPAVKCMMVEKWFHPDKSMSSKLQFHMYSVAKLIP